MEGPAVELLYEETRDVAQMSFEQLCHTLGALFGSNAGTEGLKELPMTETIKSAAALRTLQEMLSGQIRRVNALIAGDESAKEVINRAETLRVSYAPQIEDALDEVRGTLAHMKYVCASKQSQQSVDETDPWQYDCMIHEIDERLTHVEEKLGKVAHVKNTLAKYGKDRRAPQPKRRRNARCYRCGVQGHIQRHCKLNLDLIPYGEGGTPDPGEDIQSCYNGNHNTNNTPRNDIFFCRALTTVSPSTMKNEVRTKGSVNSPSKDKTVTETVLESGEKPPNESGMFSVDPELLDLVEGLKKIAEFEFPKSWYEQTPIEPFSAAKLWREARIAAKESYAKKMAQPEMQKFMLGINKIIQTRWPCEMEEGEMEGIDAAIDISSKYGHLTPAARALLGQDGPLVCCADVQESKQNRHEADGTERNP